MTKRTTYFDNIKGFLIFLVVLGHYMYTAIISKENVGFLCEYVYKMIYIIHMPFFVFITGYFSKDTEKSREKAFERLFIPYIVFNTLFCLMDVKYGEAIRFALT